MAEVQTYSGRCHCGKVRYEVDLEIKQAISCNCSICKARGLLLAFAPEDKFRLLSGEEELQDYRFNTNNIAHLFCKTCGVSSFAQGRILGRGEPMRAINLRCVEGIDIDTLPIRKFDGAKL